MEINGLLGSFALMMEAESTSKLIPWHYKPKVHYRGHNSPPAIPILSQLNPHHTSQSDSFRKVGFSS
jgi:hypothetical protein